MVRTAGARNANHAQRRAELLERVSKRLGERGATHASWRELAAAADVSLATMTHYFGKREDVIRAVLAFNLEKGEQQLSVLALPTGPFDRSIRDALAHVLIGFRYGVGDMIAVGLIEGLRHPALGPAFVDASLEPMIEALSARLVAHQRAGEMRVDVVPRFAALQLLSPIVVAHLHQVQLGASDRHPLDMGALVEHLAQTAVASLSSSPAPSAIPPRRATAARAVAAPSPSRPQRR